MRHSVSLSLFYLPELLNQETSQWRAFVDESKASRTFSPHAWPGKYSALNCPFPHFVGSSSAPRIPSLTSSSGFGLCWIFCSKLSARMCFSNRLCCPCNAGAAVESGKIFPRIVRPMPSTTRHRLKLFPPKPLQL